MRIKDLQDVIIERVEVTHQMVTLAKSFMLTNFNQFVSTMLEEFHKQQDATLVQPIVLLETDPAQTNTQATNVARFLSWQLAFVEALWDLVHAGTLLPYHDSTQHTLITVNYVETTGNRDAWTFDEFRYVYPSIVRLAPTALKKNPQALSSADLFLSDLAIPDLHPGVAESLQLAVRCFRHDLYLPCLAMLGRASEGAWLELGRSLLKVQGLPDPYRAKLANELESDKVSIFAKVKSISELYRSQAVFKCVATRSHPADHLEEVRAWSEVIRDTRNAVHYKDDGPVEIDYEKTAILLMGVAKNLGTLYRIGRAAEQVAQASHGTPT